MSVKELSREKNIVTLEITVPAEDFQKAIQQSYNKNRKYFSIQGFRKGKAPRKLIEAHYGKGVFYEDAIDFAFPKAYRAALEELEIEPVTRPELENVESIGEDGAVFKVNVGLKPAVVLNDYKGAEIESLEAVVEDADIDAELKKMQDQNARLIAADDAEAKAGDTVNIDYEGFCDGEAFAGGKAEGAPLELGSNTFIPGFEDQLIGKKAGDEVDVEVTFPEQYHSADLAGKDAVFKVKVNEVQVKELPELDDEFAKDVSEFDTLDELKKDIAEKLKEQKTQMLRRQAEVAVLDFAIEAADIDVPYLMVDEEVDRTLEGYARQMQGQGLSLDDYFKFTGTTVEDFKNNLKGDVERNIKAELILAEVAEAEKIEVTDEELDEEIKVYADAYQKDFDEFKETVNEQMAEYMKADIKRRKAIDALVDGAQVK